MEETPGEAHMMVLEAELRTVEDPFLTKWGGPPGRSLSIAQEEEHDQDRTWTGAHRGAGPLGTRQEALGGDLKV